MGVGAVEIVVIGGGVSGLTAVLASDWLYAPLPESAAPVWMTTGVHP